MKTIFLAASLCATGATAAAAPTTITIVQGGTAGDYTLTATVTGLGGTAPSGSVAFQDNDSGGAVVARAALVPSVTTLGPAITQTTTVASAEALAAGDFNGDGILDLAVPNGAGNSVTILLGKGDGTFTAGAALPTAAGAFSVVAGRFGPQGRLDLAVATSSALLIFLGNGDGTFTAGQTVALPNGAAGLAVGSFGATTADLIVTSTGRVSALLGNGDGTFQPPVDTFFPGNPEAVVAMSFGAVVVQSGEHGSMTALLNAGGGAFTLKPSIATGNGKASLAAGDFDDDGIADVAVVSALDETVTIFTGDGSGAFTAGKPIAAGQFPLGLVSADFNNDGRADLAIGSSTSGTVTVLLGRGGGAFTTSTLLAGTNAVVLAAGDFDQEGHVDLAVAGLAASNTVNVLLTQTQRTAIATATRVAPTGVGVHQVIASYPGDASYAASVSAPTGLTTAPTVTFTPSQPGLTVSKLGDAVSETILITSAGNFSGSVALACTVSFDGPGTASVFPGCLVDTTLPVAPGKPASATLAVTSVAASALPSQLPRAAMGLLLCLGFVPKLRRKKGLLLLLVAMATSSACGNDNTNIGNLGTTAGTYRIDITATSTTPPFTATTSVPLTVAGQ